MRPFRESRTTHRYQSCETWTALAYHFHIYYAFRYASDDLVLVFAPLVGTFLMVFVTSWRIRNIRDGYFMKQVRRKHTRLPARVCTKEGT